LNFCGPGVTISSHLYKRVPMYAPSLSAVSAIALLLGIATEGSSAPAANENATSVVIAEGTGKDEKEARKSAFRDAVSKVVGVLVDAETLVKNDEIISERILEFSGGFVKSYETLKVEKAGDGLVRVRIKATVERLQILGKLRDAKITVTEVRGGDLLAEKMTKEEARKNATELLEKLYSEIPKLIKVDVKGKPRLADDGKGVVLDILLSADVKAYNAFSKRAVGLLDKIAISKDTVLMSADYDERYNMWKYKPTRDFGPSDIFGKPILGQGTPRGYAVWIVTFQDGVGQKMRWNFYWVDADFRRSLRPVAGTGFIKLTFNDKDGQLVTEEEIDLSKAETTGFVEGYGAPWILCNYYGRSYKVDKEDRDTVSFYMAPIHGNVGPRTYLVEYRTGFPIHQKIKMTDAELERVKEVKTSVEFRGSFRGLPNSVGTQKAFDTTP
jgi:hypothetical protein